MLIAWGIVNTFFSKLILSQARWLLPVILATHQVAAGKLEVQGLFGLQRKLKTGLDNLERSCFKSEKLDKGWICNPIAKCWLSACKVLGSIPEKKKNNNSKYKQGRFLSSALSTQPLPDPTSIISLLWIFPDIVFCLCTPTEIKIVMFWVIFV